MAQSTPTAKIASTGKRSPHSSTQATAWDRLTTESAKAFQAFTVYRDLAADDRSLTGVSQQLSKSKSLCARWSTQFRWVQRAMAWDCHQDQLRQKRRIAEREKIQERQLQNNRIASQAIMAPLIALAKRAQTHADAFAGVSAAELTKIASAAARALPRIHEDERTLTGTAAENNIPQPLTIVGAEFGWVQGRCQCGHPWDSHDQVARPTSLNGPRTMPCEIPGCGCEHFEE